MFDNTQNDRHGYNRNYQRIGQKQQRKNYWQILIRKICWYGKIITGSR